MKLTRTLVTALGVVGILGLSSGSGVQARTVRAPDRVRPLPPLRALIDTDGDGVPDDQDPDDDDDGLSDVEEARLGTSRVKADTDGDGYTDYQETTDARLTHPPADLRTPGLTGCSPLRRDIVIELDYLGPKKTWFVRHCGHEPGREPLMDMIERFHEHGWGVFICIDDEVPHVAGGTDREELERADLFALRDRYRDVPVYYYGFYADEAGDALEKTGKHGVSWSAHDHFVVFDGVWYLVGDLVGMTAMHELGHLLIDRYPANPAAAHLVSVPSEWNDGAHCPNDCVMNYASKLSLGELLGQWWEFDFCAPCWAALRGFYDRT